MRSPVTAALTVGLAVLALLTALGPGRPPADAQGLGKRRTAPSQPPAPAAPARRAPQAPAAREVRLVIGALVPLVGPGAWFGDEIRRGLELAALRINPSAPEGQRSGTVRSREAPAAAEGSREDDGPGDQRAATRERAAPLAQTEGPAGEGRGQEERGIAQDGESAGSSDVESGAPRLRMVVRVEHAEPLDPKAEVAAWQAVIAAGARVVLTASPAPTMVVQPLAAGSDVLLVHQGFRTERLPAGPALLQTRPSPADLGRAAAAYARQRGVRRLALVSAGGEFGKGVRAALVAAWQALGMTPVYDESLTPESPDLDARLRRAVSAGPEGLVLAYRGVELGTMAVRLRAQGLAAPILALDDDPIAALQAGPDLADVLVLSDAFVDPGEDTVFAGAYRAKHGREPSRYAAHAYETAMLVARAAQQVVRAGRDLGGARLREALRDTEVVDSAFPGPVAFADDGTLHRPLAISALERSRLFFIRYLERPPVGKTPTR